MTGFRLATTQIQEADILRDVVAYLKSELGRKVRYFERRNSGAAFRGNGEWAGWYYQAYFPNKRITSGMPDLTIISNNFNLILVELKSKTGKLSPSQQIARNELEKTGIKYLIAHEVSDVKNLLESLCTN